MSMPLEQRGTAVRLTVRVQSRASRTELAGLHGDALKVRLAAPPVEGAANAELVKIIAKRVGVAKSRVRIVAGESSRDKVVQIDGASVAQVRVALGLP